MAYTWRLLQDQSSEAGIEDWSWTDIYLVQGYVPGANPAIVDMMADAPGFTPGTPHSTIAFARVASLSPERIEDTDDWAVSVTYERTIRPGDERDDPDSPNYGVSPLLLPAKITARYETQEKHTYEFVDPAGEKILNEAGDLIADVMKPVAHWVFDVEKNLAAWPAWILTYANAVNSDSVTVNGLAIAAGYLKVSGLTISDLQTDTVAGVRVNYYVVNFSLEYNPDTWESKIQNRGVRCKDANGDLVRCRDSEGFEATEPMFLAADGTQLPLPIVPANITTIDGWLHERKSFASLPLT